MITRIGAVLAKEVFQIHSVHASESKKHTRKLKHHEFVDYIVTHISPTALSAWKFAAARNSELFWAYVVRKSQKAFRHLSAITLHGLTT